jgi:hypothetical protein
MLFISNLPVKRKELFPEFPVVPGAHGNEQIPRPENGLQRFIPIQRKKKKKNVFLPAGNAGV